jgi:transposase
VIHASRLQQAEVMQLGKSYSQDLRGRVLGAIDSGTAAAEVAALFRVSLSYIYKALGRRRSTGETEARPQRNQQTLKLAPLHEAIRDEVLRRPDATLEELRAWLRQTHGVEASLGLMHKTLVRLGLTHKKSRGGHKNRTGPMSPVGDGSGDACSSG